MQRIWATDTSSHFRKWALTGSFYKEYGEHLIRKHPLDFIKYFVKPNIVHFFIPKTEFLSNYNMGRDTVDNFATIWFGLKNKQVANQKDGLEMKIPSGLRILFPIIHSMFLLSFVLSWIIRGSVKTNHDMQKIMGMAFLLWSCNFLFSILTAPVVLRYQLFPIITTFTFGGLVINHIIDKVRSVKLQKSVHEKKTTFRQETFV